MSAPRTRAALLALWSLVAADPGWAADGEPFEPVRLQVPGRPVDAAGGPGWLAIASAEGSPPAERRWITVFAPAFPPRPWAPIPVPPDVVAFDAAKPDPAARGPELVLVSADHLSVLAADGAVLRRIPLAPPLPLPARTRQVSRLGMLGDWQGTGRLEALLPSLSGFRLQPLDGEPARELVVPRETEYLVFGNGPEFGEGFFTAEITWPQLAQADDDGDGRADLFISDRFGLQVYRAGAGGLAIQPSRSEAFSPFSFDEEQRHRSSTLRALPADLDGDGDADLVVTRTVGQLRASHTTTQLFRNASGGAHPSAAPDLVLEEQGGFGGVQVVDVDGDGRDELMQLVVPFGLAQLIRLLTLRRVEADLRLLNVDLGPGPSVVESWRASLRYGLDLDRGRILGLLPVVDGDWNGDGVRDLLHADGPERLTIRLGERGPRGPVFESPIVSQKIAATERSLVLDADADGHDDLLVWDVMPADGVVELLRNRGQLPHTAPVLEPSAGEAP